MLNDDDDAIAYDDDAIANDDDDPVGYGHVGMLLLQCFIIKIILEEDKLALLDCKEIL